MSVRFTALAVFVCSFFISAPAYAQTPDVAAVAGWPDWIGAPSFGQLPSTYAKADVYYVRGQAVSFDPVPTFEVTMPEDPTAYAVPAHTVSIPEEYRPIHYRQIMVQDVTGLPPAIVTTGAGYWPEWIGRPYWLR